MQTKRRLWIGLTWLLCAPGVLVAGDQGYFGAQLQDHEDGAEILTILPQSPAAQAGFQAGDVILKVGGADAGAAKSLAAALQQSGRTEYRESHISQRACHALDGADARP